MTDQALLSINDAAKFLGVHIETLRRWDRSGQFKAIRITGNNYRKYNIEILNKFKQGELKKLNSAASFPTSIYADNQIDFFSPAIPDSGYFTRVVFAVASKVEKLSDCELIDGPYDKKRDIFGYQLSRYNKRELVYIQCKHVRDITDDDLKKEVASLYKHISDNSIKKPYKIVFALASTINSTIRDSVRNYVEQLLNIPTSRVVFWCPSELDLKIKSDYSILKQFILSGSINIDNSSSTPQIKELTPKYENIKRTLTRSSQLIQGRQFKEAEEKLKILLAQIPEDEQYLNEKAKIYNNLGLCYKWSDIQSPNYTKAIEAFDKSLDLDPDFSKAKCNLANTLLLTKNKEDDKKAWEIVNDLWKNTGPKDEFIVITYIQTYSIIFGRSKGLEEAIKVKDDLIKKDKTDLVENIGFWHFLAATYFFENKFDDCQTYIDKILEQNQFDIDALYLNAMVKMCKAKDDTSDVFNDFLDNYKNSKEIRSVELLLRNAYTLARENERYDLLPEIYHNWNVCRLWLWKMYGERLEKLDYPLPEETRIETNKISEVPEKLLEKDPEGAYLAYKTNSKIHKLSPGGELNVAWIFRDYGYPEISLRILNDLERVEPNAGNSYKYWLFKSTCQILMEDKAQAIQSCNKAKELAKDDKDALKVVLSHTGALLMRFDKEGDRLLQNAIEYDNEFPLQKMLTKLDINNEKDQKFIRESMIQRKQWFENILDIYTSKPLPVYVLQKTFRSSFIELWEGRGANFPWEFNIPGIDYQKHQTDLLNDSEEMVLDYMSLLTLTKANLLGFVERLNKTIYVHRLTFEKIQDELVQHESKTLRKLWNYLRKSTQIVFISANEELDEGLGKLTKVFETWLLQSIQLAKNKKSLFVTDDLRLAKVLTNDNLKVINSFTFLAYAYDNKWIEKRDYSQILGEISDCVYSFIPFNYEDLHEIVWQDDYKLTRRSFHLIHQIFLSGSDVISFMSVFVYFIRHLWMSGALSEDKIFWLKFVTDEISLLFEKWENEGRKTTEVDKEFVDRFALMWGSAIQSGNVDDIKALQKELENIDEKSLIFKLKNSIKIHIALRLGALNAKPLGVKSIEGKG